MYAAMSKAGDKTVPKDKIHVFCIRTECYELDSSDADSETTFQVLFAQCEGNPKLARALLTLAETIKVNERLLKDILQ